MASILLRQDIDEHWFDLPDTSREYIKENLVIKICNSTDLSVIRNLEDSIFIVATQEYPSNWPNVLMQIGEYLVKEDDMQKFGALCALRGIVKRFKTVKGLSREPLFQIVECAFPIIQNMFGERLESTDQKDLMLLRVITKIFYMTNYVVVSHITFRQKSPLELTSWPGSHASTQSSEEILATLRSLQMTQSRRISRMIILLGG